LQDLLVTRYYDIPLIAERFPDYIGYFLNFAFGTDQSNWIIGSPSRAKHEKYSKAKWLLIHSKGDELVDIKQPEVFYLHLQELGILADTDYTDRGTHFAALDAIGTDIECLPQIVAKFISKN